MLITLIQIYTSINRLSDIKFALPLFALLTLLAHLGLGLCSSSFMLQSCVQETPCMAHNLMSIRPKCHCNHNCNTNPTVKSTSVKQNCNTDNTIHLQKQPARNHQPQNQVEL
mmetsp:Transcript_6163/g.11462  ORF Transcript_6163/g.11462 Transcript_6163/m.11462 type:complete len:112 (+) Transcript_6163:297-632(+)